MLKKPSPSRVDTRSNEGPEPVRVYTVKRVYRDLVYLVSGEERLWVPSSDVLLDADAQIAFRRGLFWLGKKDDDKAIAEFNESIGLTPNDARAHYNRARAWKRKGEYARARPISTRRSDSTPNPRQPTTHGHGSGRPARTPGFATGEKPLSRLGRPATSPGARPPPSIWTPWRRPTPRRAISRTRSGLRPGQTRRPRERNGGRPGIRDSLSIGRRDLIGSRPAAAPGRRNRNRDNRNRTATGTSLNHPDG